MRKGACDVGGVRVSVAVVAGISASIIVGLTATV